MTDPIKSLEGLAAMPAPAGCDAIAAAARELARRNSALEWEVALLRERVEGWSAELRRLEALVAVAWMAWAALVWRSPW